MSRCPSRAVTETEGQGLRILPLAEGDIEAVIKLAGVIWRHHYPGIISMEQIEYMLAQRYTPVLVRAQLQREDAWWEIALAGSRMIGFVQYELSEREPQPRVMKLNQIYVREECQRQGHGGRILAHVLERAQCCGCELVRLYVNRHNANSIAAYRKHGYAVAGTALTAIGGGFVMDDYVMEKKL